MNRSIFSLLVPVLLAGGGLAARAQTGADSKPVTLNVSQVPIQTVLKTLFNGAGVRSFVIDADVPRTALVGSISLSGVPFSVALKQVLGAVSPPLVAELQDGIYHVRTSASAPPDFGPQAGFPPADAGQNNIYKIRIRHYDAGMIADALTRRGGIIQLPPNFVIPSSASVAGGPTGPNITTVGAAAGQPPAAPNGGGLQNGTATGANVLPPGVKRIFILASDNSLVVEATAQGYENLTDERLLSGGYTPVY